MNQPILQLDLPGIKKVRSGKVREVFDLGDRLLMVASDRLSAFDVIMPNGIPRKGEVLTQISHFWFEKFCWSMACERNSMRHFFRNVITWNLKPKTSYFRA